MTFNQIKTKVDFLHNTLQQHLEELLEKGLIERNKKGRRINPEDPLTSTRYLKTLREGLLALFLSLELTGWSYLLTHYVVFVGTRRVVTAKRSEDTAEP